MVDQATRLLFTNWVGEMLTDWKEDCLFNFEHRTVELEIFFAKFISRSSARMLLLLEQKKFASIRLNLSNLPKMVFAGINLP